MTTPDKRTIKIKQTFEFVLTYDEFIHPEAYDPEITPMVRKELVDMTDGDFEYKLNPKYNKLFMTSDAILELIDELADRQRTKQDRYYDKFKSERMDK
jgi:hypothetical protein